MDLEKGFKPLVSNLEKQLIVDREHLCKSPLGVGIDGLNKMFRPGQLVIIAGRSKHGKSTLSYNFLLSLLQREKKCLYLSYEIPAGLLCARLAQIAAKKENYPDISDCTFDVLKNSDHQDWNQSIKSIIKFHTDGFFQVAIEQELETFDKIKGMVVKHKPGVLFVDHIARVPAINAQVFSEQQQLAEVARAFKQLAKLSNMVVFLIVQTNRDGQSRPKPMDRAPSMENIRGSDAIFHEADSVLGLFAPVRALKPIEKNGKDVVDLSMADRQPYFVYVLKNRWGQEHRVKLWVHWSSGFMVQTDDNDADFDDAINTVKSATAEEQNENSTFLQPKKSLRKPKRKDYS